MHSERLTLGNATQHSTDGYSTYSCIASHIESTCYWLVQTH